MPIPTFDALLLPLLRFAADGAEHHLREAVTALADHLQLTDTERNALLPGGSRRKFDDRVGWAKTYLLKACLLERTGRGTFIITERGLRVLAYEPDFLDTDTLRQFPEFEAFLHESRLRRRDYELLSHQTPHVLMETAFDNLMIDLSDSLLDQVLAASPAFFERLVLDLLLAMGYGGAQGAAAQTLGRSGDGGLDGVIQEDRLGLNKIYVQAKRWGRDHAVGRPVIQGFVGSLLGVGANRGVLLTTSRFTNEAIEYAKTVSGVQVILIDGRALTTFMIEHNVGVQVERTYVVKGVDREYFNSEDKRRG